MKIRIAGIVSVGCLAASAALASAQPPPFGYPPQAPDACGPGSYSTNACGGVYGPNYWLRPNFPPFNGMLPPGFPGGPGGFGPGMGRGMGCGMSPGMGCGMGPGMGSGMGGPGSGGPQGIAAFPTHPYARGPRDYFMLD
jgi:hypothetical protein